MRLTLALLLLLLFVPIGTTGVDSTRWRADQPADDEPDPCADSGDACARVHIPVG